MAFLALAKTVNYTPNTVVFKATDTTKTHLATELYLQYLLTYWPTDSLLNKTVYTLLTIKYFHFLRKISYIIQATYTTNKTVLYQAIIEYSR